MYGKMHADNKKIFQSIYFTCVINTVQCTPVETLHILFQRTRLLDNTEKLERSGRRLEEGYKMCVETGEEKLFLIILLISVYLWLSTALLHCVYGNHPIMYG